MADKLVKSTDTMRRVMDEGIRPHSEALARIALARDVAVAVFEVNDRNKWVLRTMGWDGRAAVFPMPNDYRKRLARISDTVTAAWLTRDPANVARVFVWSGIGTILLNFALKRGWWIEPGSLADEFV